MPCHHSAITLLLLTCAAPALAQGSAELRVREAEFEQHVRPVLVGQCLKCHGATKQEGGLRLDSRDAVLRGGESGPAVIPGKPDDSLLLAAVRYSGPEMPPSGPLPQRQVRSIAAWIAAGAIWPEGSVLRPSGNRLSPADRDWWAFRPVRDPKVPLSDDAWCGNEIDRFVLARMQAAGVRPAPRAAPNVLVRRLYFDLLGLPPTPEQIAAFEADDSPAAWERLVDSLLASPRYGEQWARSWLDVVRYAESDGWNQDAYRPHIWRYRDYVVDSFNSDRPWPEFVRQQLAGDEMPGDAPENLAATGFLRLGIYEYNQRDARGLWNDILNETTDVVGDAFLGIGIACARCHDHKFDPLLQRDYFKLRAFFEPIEWRDDLVLATAKQQSEYLERRAEWERATADIRARIDALLEPYYKRKWQSTVAKFPLDIQACFHKPRAERNSWEHQMAYLVSRQFEEEGGGPLKSLSKSDKQRYEELKQELAAIPAPAPPPPVMAATDFFGPASPTVIPDSGGAVVEPGFLTVLTGDDVPAVIRRAGRSSGRRSALAEWISRGDNPLTTRVFVNRIWQKHFGRGLVASPNDFGRQGQPPTHPELLDWLVSRFVEGGFSVKRLHRRILLSSTWQQSARNGGAAVFRQADPQEFLLWRSRVRRLSAEQIRDAMLMLSGELEHQLGGPGVPADSPRRSLYVRSLRNTPDEFLHAFDMANGLRSVAERNSTTTPIQALMMINGSWAIGRAQSFAERLRQRSDATVDAMIVHAVRSATGRRPEAVERQQAADFLGVSLSDEVAAVDAVSLADFCHVLLTSNEFLYVD